MSILLAVALIGTTAVAAWIGKAIADLIEVGVRWICR